MKVSSNIGIFKMQYSSYHHKRSEEIRRFFEVLWGDDRSGMRGFEISNCVEGL